MRTRVVTVTAAVLAVLLVWFLLGMLPAMIARSARSEGETPLQRVGTFGDSFGAVNSLFSALALAGVAIALMLQYHDQRESDRRTEESRSHQTELAMLGALIQARSTLLASYMATSKDIAEFVDVPRDTPEGRKEWMKIHSIADRVDDQRREVERLITTAEAKIGWKSSARVSNDEDRAWVILEEGKRFEKDGLFGLALQDYRLVVTDHPGTAEATEAAARIKGLAGRTAELAADA